MKCTDARDSLYESFDTGASISPALWDHLQSCGECAAEHRYLNAMNAALIDLPIEQPDPRMVSRIKIAIARDRAFTRQRVAMACVAAAALLISAVVNWYVPVVDEAVNAWTQFEAMLPQDPWLLPEMSLSIDLSMIEMRWNEIVQASQLVTGSVYWWALAVTIVLLVGFNGWEAARLRVAGNRRGK